ncbi:hypothetical protein [Streptomyces niger]|uniref:hypothetical protein n=1 Tax=Streptomyces niger TaxID=66373 RepID=UPI0018FE4AD5|nr:hypothetical protein [Streptomyces niger]
MQRQRLVSFAVAVVTAVGLALTAAPGASADPYADPVDSLQCITGGGHLVTNTFTRETLCKGGIYNGASVFPFPMGAAHMAE